MNLSTKKLFHLIQSLLVVGALVLFFYPLGERFISSISTGLFVKPYLSLNLPEPKDLSGFPSASAVPILMYHGVVRHPDGVNTSRRLFIKQMETLKKEGFETIALSELDDFLKGKFVLPPRPIIITFDDGRRDSFYPVDAIFRRLGFRGAIFIATIKANEKDPFYLSWREINKAKNTGRFEIEAHGRRSHEKVIADTYGNHGRFLVARIFGDNGLESVEDYKRRVEEDYVNGVIDIKRNLGFIPRYFAVPFSDFGLHQGISNVEIAVVFNRELVKKYFRLAFYEVSTYEDSGWPLETFYNFKDTDPYHLRRLEVKEMGAESLLRALEEFRPRPGGTTNQNDS